jgi:hypothetical protein
MDYFRKQNQIGWPGKAGFTSAIYQQQAVR